MCSMAYRRKSFSRYRGKGRKSLRKFQRYARMYGLIRSKPEIKCCDTEINTFALSALVAGTPYVPTNVLLFTGAGVHNLIPINLCTQGTDINQRIGRKTTCRSVELRLNCFNIVDAVAIGAAQLTGPTWSATSTQYIMPTFDRVRISLVLDRNPAGAFFNYNDVWSDVSGNVNGMDTVRNLSNRQRFKVLGQWDVIVPGSTVHYTGTFGWRSFHKYIKCKIPVIYNQTSTGTISAANKNVLYLCVQGDGYPVNLNVPGSPSYQAAPMYIEGYARVRFVDE